MLHTRCLEGRMVQAQRCNSSDWEKPGQRAAQGQLGCVWIP